MTGARARGRRSLVHRIRRGRDDQGVSLILGAMLIMGIGLAAYSTYQVTVVPEKEAQAEAAQLRDVGRQLAEIKAELDRQLENTSILPAAKPVSLTGASAVFSGVDAPRASLSFEPGSADVRIDAHKLRITQRNKTLVKGIDETWQSASAGDTVEGIEWVESFRLRIDEIGKSHDGDAINVTITDADGNYAGKFEVHQESDPPESALYYTVSDADDNVLYDNSILIHQANTYSPFWVDLMDDTYRFLRVVNSAKTPFDVTVNEDGLTGDYALTYAKSSGGSFGSIIIVGAGGGDVVDDFKRVYDGGRLVYSTEYHRLDGQTYEMASGALILRQDDGEVFKVRPNFEAGLVDNIVSLRLTVPTLVGATTHVSGTDTGTVYVAGKTQDSFQADATNFTIRVDTREATLWADAWRTELTDAGLTEGDQFDITTTTSDAKLDVWGLLDPDPTSDQYDLFVSFWQADIALALDG